MNGVKPDTETPEAPPRRRMPPALRIAQVALIAATAYFLIAYLARSWSSVRDFDWSFSPGWLALSGAAFLLFYFLQALAWWLLLRGVALQSPPSLAIATWSKSILARYIPGNIFMFVGRAWMSHDQGLPLDRVTAAMVYEQALQVCSALVAAALLFPFWEWHRGITAISLLGVPLIVVLLHPRVFSPVAAWLLRLLHRPAIAGDDELQVGPGPACLLRCGLGPGGRWSLASGARRHRPWCRRATARARRVRARLRHRHGRVRLSQWHRRA